MPRKTDSKNPADWLWIAAIDLTVIELATKQEIGFPTVRSKLAEVLEKIMKAELIRSGWRLEKTHDLERLYEALVAGGSDLCAKVGPLCDELAEVYFTDRYPGFDLDDPRLAGPARAGGASHRFAGRGAGPSHSAGRLTRSPADCGFAAGPPKPELRGGVRGARASRVLAMASRHRELPHAAESRIGHAFPWACRRKSVLAGRQNQHAGRARSPETAASRCPPRNVPYRGGAGTKSICRL